MGVGCHFLLQGIFPTQGSNPGLLHCRGILYHLSHQDLDSILHAVLCFAQSLSLVQLFETLWTGSSIHGVLQARILEWAAMPSSRGSSQPRDQTQVSCIAGRFFLSFESPGKPENTGVGSLSHPRRSSGPRNRTRVSCTAGGFYTSKLPGKPNILHS